jgi:hypothetical protein
LGSGRALCFLLELTVTAIATADIETAAEQLAEHGGWTQPADALEMPTAPIAPSAR